jgi:hypothetical protein
MQDQHKHYVYALYREDGVTPFYIGMGCGDRWLDHERYINTRKDNPHKVNIIKSMLDKGMKVPKKKLAVGLSREQAFSIEIELISKIGRTCEGGPLVNVTAGGEVGNTSTGRVFSEETRAKLSASKKGRKASEETRAKMSSIAKDRKYSDETRAKMSESKKGHILSEEGRRKVSEAKKAYWTPENREKSSLRQKGRKGNVISEEQKLKISSSLKGRVRSEETKAKMREAWKRRKALASSQKQSGVE